MRYSCHPCAAVFWAGLTCVVAASTEPAATSSSAAAAADDEAVWGERIELPADPQAWINSHPLTLERLKGKTALVWFFDEECPLCVEQWPRLMQISRKWSDRPVAFIAVNSGNSRAAVEQYVRSNHVLWPVIVDSDRSLEKACKMEISLDCVYQMTLISPDGKMWYGYHDKLESELEERMPKAKWEIDAKDVPDSLRQAWRQAEFGDYASAAPVIKRYLPSTTAALRECAERLQALGERQLAARLDSLRRAKSDATPWETYRRYRAVAEEFAGLKLPTEAEAAMKSLEADPQVRNELEADRLWRTIETAVAKGGAAGVPVGIVTRLLKQYPNSDAARKARTTLGLPAPSGG